jgi:hypothetical protein
MTPCRSPCNHCSAVQQGPSVFIPLLLPTQSLVKHTEHAVLYKLSCKLRVQRRCMHQPPPKVTSTRQVKQTVS